MQHSKLYSDSSLVFGSWVSSKLWRTKRFMWKTWYPARFLVVVAVEETSLQASRLLVCVRSNAELSSLSLIVSRTKDPQMFLVTGMEGIFVMTFPNIVTQTAYLILGPVLSSHQRIILVCLFWSGNLQLCSLTSEFHYGLTRVLWAAGCIQKIILLFLQHLAFSVWL